MKEMPFGFTTMPRWSSLLPVSQFARTLLHLYAEFASVSQGYVAWVTDARAAILLNISERYVKRGKAELKRQKFITVSRNAPGLPSQITINWNTVAQVGAVCAMSKGLKILELEPILEEQVEGHIVQGRSAPEFPIEVNQSARLGGTIVPTKQEVVKQEVVNSNPLPAVATALLIWGQAELKKQRPKAPPPPPWNWPACTLQVKRFLTGLNGSDLEAAARAAAAEWLWAMCEVDDNNPNWRIADAACDPKVFFTSADVIEKVRRNITPQFKADAMTAFDEWRASQIAARPEG